MLLIPCPWCGPRDEIEFHYGGEAHIARPADPGVRGAFSTIENEKISEEP